MCIFRQMCALILLGGLAIAPAHAQSAQVCDYTINSLPMVIGAAGNYCLTHNFMIQLESGNAITVSTHNVTIDCNGYQINNEASSEATLAIGIYADSSRKNITVRNCLIRAFNYGVELLGGSGHLIEDNRFDNNRYVGIRVNGENNQVLRNRVFYNGSKFNIYSYGWGIYASADVIDNTVAGVIASGPNVSTWGITMLGAGTEARGNLIRGLTATGTGTAVGIRVTAPGVTLDRNRVSATATTAGIGISGNTDTFCMNNTVAYFGTTIASCRSSGGNDSY